MRNRLKHQIPIYMRLVKAKKIGSALRTRGHKGLCYRKRQQRTTQNERRKGKIPEADAPNVENQGGEIVSDDSKRWSCTETSVGNSGWPQKASRHLHNTVYKYSTIIYHGSSSESAQLAGEEQRGPGWSGSPR